MIKYFKELLITLKNIEKHLSEIAECVNDAPKHGIGKTIKTSHWND